MRPNAENISILIEQETVNASRIITDLLDYSHIQPLKPIACDAAGYRK